MDIRIAKAKSAILNCVGVCETMRFANPLAHQSDGRLPQKEPISYMISPLVVDG